MRKMKKRILVFVLSAIMLFHAVSFAEVMPGDIPENPRQIPSSVYQAPFPADQFTTQYAPWLRNFHLLSLNEEERGLYGGEGCQMIRIMEASPVNSDLVYFIVPNYCGYPCANYFAFNERSVGYFNMDPLRMDRYMSVTKRFIIVSNSEDHFAEAMQQQTNEIPDILYLRSSKYGKQSIAGDIMDSDEAKAVLEAFLCNDRLL